MRLSLTVVLSVALLFTLACSEDEKEPGSSVNNASTTTNNKTTPNNIKNNQSQKYSVTALSAVISGGFDATWTKEQMKFEGYCVFGGSELNWSGPNDTAIKLNLKLDEPGTYTFESLPTDFGDKLGIGLMSVGDPAPGIFYTRVASSSTITFEQVPGRSGGGKLKGTLELNLFNPNKLDTPPVKITLLFDHDFTAHLCA